MASADAVDEFVELGDMYPLSSSWPIKSALIALVALREDEHSIKLFALQLGWADFAILPMAICMSLQKFISMCSPLDSNTDQEEIFPLHMPFKAKCISTEYSEPCMVYEASRLRGFECSCHIHQDELCGNWIQVRLGAEIRVCYWMCRDDRQTLPIGREYPRCPRLWRGGCLQANPVSGLQS